MEKVILYKNESGTIFQATDFRQVNKQALIKEIASAKAHLSKLQTILAQYNSLESAANGTDTEAKTSLKSITDADGNIKFVKKAATDEPPLTPITPIHPIII